MIDIFSLTFNNTNVILNIIFLGAFILNLIFAFTIMFMERRSAGAVWAWLLVLVFIPILGFIIYLLFGRQIQRDRIFTLDEEDKIGIEMIVNEQLEALKNDEFSKGNHQIVKFKDMVQMLLYNNAAFLTTDNDIDIFTDGREKFDALIKDINEA
ncbi:MAG: PLDc N-terminal domain-containing protein, partial [Staphylococcus equorum]